MSETGPRLKTTVGPVELESQGSIAETSPLVQNIRNEGNNDPRNGPVRTGIDYRTVYEQDKAGMVVMAADKAAREEANKAREEARDAVNVGGSKRKSRRRRHKSRRRRHKKSTRRRPRKY